MDHSFIIRQIGNNQPVFNSLFQNISQTEYLWKPLPEKWCLLEIVCHLYDEEREDFRTRVRQVLEDPSKPLPPIDPVGWVLSRKYLEQDFEKVVTQFINERTQTLNWLKSLSSPSWKNAYHHPKFGLMSAEMFLANWLAHDYLHIRQITALKFNYLKEVSGETLKYAGVW